MLPTDPVEIGRPTPGWSLLPPACYCEPSLVRGWWREGGTETLVMRCIETTRRHNAGVI